MAFDRLSGVCFAIDVRRLRLGLLTVSILPGIFDKESKVVTGRRPFAKDVAVFDYDYESELEWEEEEEGEDLDSDEEDDDDRGSRTSMESDEEDDWLVEDDDRADESGVGTPRPSSPTGRKPKARRILDAVIIDTGYDDLFLGELAPNPKFIDFTGELVVDGLLTPF